MEVKMAPKATEEQILYANILNKGMLIGLIGLIITFIIYITGILKPVIPLGKVQHYWVMSVGDYLHESGIHTGWSWLKNIGYGDMLNFIPIAILSGLTIICYLSIIPWLLRKKDMPYVVLALLEVIVLCVAASGLLGTGGH
jgi:hypothetical protein